MVLIECYFVWFAILILKSNADIHDGSFGVRVKRQDGYVYDKPSVSFDLPPRQSPSSTQAPNVDRTVSLQMYYAYPVPGGAASTAGSSSTTAATTAATAGGGAGYNYGSSPNNNVGYDYNSPASGPQDGVQTSNAGTQTNIGANSGYSSNAGFSTGYGYNTPSPTLGPSLQTGSVSTNAPKYLPPVPNTGSVNIGGGSIASTYAPATGGSRSTSPSTVSSQTPSLPSDNYLPPLGTSSTAGVQIGVTGSPSTQANTGGSISVPSSGYLPPNESSAPSGSTPNTSPQPTPPSSGYIPPSNSGASIGTVSPPASTYLPPSF